MSTKCAIENSKIVKRVVHKSVIPDEIPTSIFKLNKVSLHCRCDCKLCENVKSIYDEANQYLFQQRTKYGKKNIWYIINKISIPLIIDKSFDIFPCKGISERNGFIWFISEDFETLTYLKQKSDEVMKIIKSKNNIKRDYHSPAILKCKNEEYIIDSVINNKNIANCNRNDIHYGFTCKHIPKNDNMYVLGIIQEKTGRYKYTHFNAPGGKKEMIWNKRNSKFTIETIEKSSIRETWEELGIELDMKLFNYCLTLSEEKNLNPNYGEINDNVFVYKLYIPKINKLEIKKSHWNNPEKCRYLISLKK